jgi:hypothetical protein
MILMRVWLFLAFVLMLIPTVANAATPIQDVVDAPVPIRPDGGRYSIDDVRAAIIKGSQTQLWTAEIAGDRTIRAKLNVKNKHFAIVEIPYSESSYSIIYVSSENLQYNPSRRTIHRNYNGWVLQLSTLIKEQFNSLAADTRFSDSGHGAQNSDREDLFDALLKLDDLRDRGILTDEEFENEKRKLLERN